MEKAKIVLIGLSGNAREAFETIEGEFHIAAFLDDRADLHGTTFEGVPVFSTSAISQFPEAGVMCLIGSSESFPKRPEAIRRMALPLARYAIVLSPRANVSRFSQIGFGSLVFPGVSIMGNAEIGNHVVVLPNSVIHHDSRIGDYTVIGSGAVIAGNVDIGQGCYLGSGCRIRNGIRLGEGCLVGMGATVLDDVAPGQVVVGNPARALIRPQPQAALLSGLSAG